MQLQRENKTISWLLSNKIVTQYEKNEILTLIKFCVKLLLDTKHETRTKRENERVCVKL